MVLPGIASIAANGAIKVQGGGHMQHTENARLAGAVDDETSGNNEFSATDEGPTTDQR
jgi:hypothetical protein